MPRRRHRPPSRDTAVSIVAVQPGGFQPCGPARTRSRSVRSSFSKASSQPEKVLPLLDRSAEQHVRTLQSVASDDPRGLVEMERMCSNSPGDQPQALPLDPRGVACVDRGSRRAHDEPGVAPCELEPPLQDDARNATCNGPDDSGTSRSCTVATNGAFEGGTTYPSVVHDVHGSRRSLDHRMAQPLPGLVQRPPRKR